MSKAPTIKDVKSDVAWTKTYIGYILDAKRRGDFAAAAQWANEISAIWGTISWKFEEAEAPEATETDIIAETAGARFAIVDIHDNEGVIA